MAATIIGKVKAPSGKTFEVKWDSSSKQVYVAVSGWSLVGKANSSSEAMMKAEAFVYNK